MDYKLGRVTSIVDPLRFVIKFTIDNYIEDAVAYPIDTFDEPNVGNPIQVYEIESILGWSFVYKKQRLDDYTRLKLGNSTVEITDEGINILTSSGNDVFINSDGGVTINSANNINISSSGNININGSGNVNVESSSTLSLKGSMIKSQNSSVPPTGKGPFCAIKICPYTGQPHVGDTVI